MNTQESIIQTPRNRSKSSGFTLFVSIVVMGTLLLISMGVVTLALRQSILASAGRESQYAFYAADTGIECALYWDLKNSTGFSAFSTTTGSTISCAGDNHIVGGSLQSEFELVFSPDPYYVRVVVTKSLDGATLIESYGYNTQDSSNPRRVERAIRVAY